MRGFSTTARSLLRFIWRGTTSRPEYESTLKDKMSRNSKLAAADKVEFHGEPHISPQDPDMRVSGKIFEGDRRVTSVHVYADGTVVYSKSSVNEAQD